MFVSFLCGCRLAQPYGLHFCILEDADSSHGNSLSIYICGGKVAFILTLPRPCVRRGSLVALGRTFFVTFPLIQVFSTNKRHNSDSISEIVMIKQYIIL